MDVSVIHLLATQHRLQEIFSNPVVHLVLKSSDVWPLTTVLQDKYGNRSQPSSSFSFLGKASAAGRASPKTSSLAPPEMSSVNNTRSGSELKETSPSSGQLGTSRSEAPSYSTQASTQLQPPRTGPVVFSTSLGNTVRIHCGTDACRDKFRAQEDRILELETQVLHLRRELEDAEDLIAQMKQQEGKGVPDQPVTEPPISEQVADNPVQQQPARPRFADQVTDLSVESNETAGSAKFGVPPPHATMRNTLVSAERRIMETRKASSQRGGDMKNYAMVAMANTFTKKPSKPRLSRATREARKFNRALFPPPTVNREPRELLPRATVEDKDDVRVRSPRVRREARECEPTTATKEEAAGTPAGERSNQQRRPPLPTSQPLPVRPSISEVPEKDATCSTTVPTKRKAAELDAEKEAELAARRRREEDHAWLTASCVEQAARYRGRRRDWY